MKAILVVDDEYPTVQFLRLILEDQDHQVLTASNGRDGLTIAISHKIDLIISDVMMPIMTGPQMCHALQQDAAHPSPPIILMSATGEPENKDSCHYAGFLPKPFSLDSLEAAVAAILGSADDTDSSSH